jgi:hypothetical protein
MELTSLSYTYGITGLLIVISSILIAGYLLLIYTRSKDQSTLTLVLAILVFVMGSPWIGISTNFLTALFDREYIGDRGYILLASFWIFGLPPALYVTTSLINPDKTKLYLALSLVISMIMFFVVYALIPADIIQISSVFESTPAESGGLPDAKYKGILGLYLIITIGVLLISGIMFILTAYRTQIPLVKARAIPIGIGQLFYSILGAIDGILAINSEILVLFVRIGIFVSLFLLMIGVTLPKIIFKRFGIERPTN